MRVLANFLDGFKQQNPKIFAIIAGVLIIVQSGLMWALTAENGDVLLIVEDSVRTALAVALEVVVVLIALISPRTYKFKTKTPEELLDEELVKEGRKVIKNPYTDKDSKFNKNS